MCCAVHAAHIGKNETVAVVMAHGRVCSNASEQNCTHAYLAVLLSACNTLHVALAGLSPFACNTTAQAIVPILAQK